MGELRPHQIEPAAALEKLLRSGQNAVDLSDTGVGKTFVATYVAKKFGKATLAVVPKISKTAWHKAADCFDDNISVVSYEELRLGRSGFGQWSNNPPMAFRNERWFRCFCCQRRVDFDNYEPCYVHPKGIHCIEEKKTPWKYGKFIFNPEIGLLIFDEAHRVNGVKSRNADLLIAAKRQNIKTLLLSATLADSPLKFRAIGFSLGLHGLGNFYSWAHRYGCGKLPGIPGFHWLLGKDKQKECLERLNRELIPARGVRVRVADIPGFPERTISAETFDVDNPEEISHLYEAMEQLKTRAALDASPDHPLTALLRARQIIELLKIPIFVELVQDALEKGMSVGCFLNFRQTIDELSRRLKTTCIIDGSPEGVRDRQKHIDDFQSGASRLMILNSFAGGISISLHDQEGTRPRLGLVSPPQSAVVFRQLCGRFHREGGKSHCFYKVILAANSVEMSIQKKLENKLANLDAINDMDFEP